MDIANLFIRATVFITRFIFGVSLWPGVLEKPRVVKVSGFFLPLLVASLLAKPLWGYLTTTPNEKLGQMTFQEFIVSFSLESVFKYQDYFRLCFLIALGLLIFIWLGRNLLRMRGGTKHGGCGNYEDRIALDSLILRTIFFWRKTHVIKVMHRFQHVKDRFTVMMESSGEKISVKSDTFREGMEQLLGQAQLAFNWLLVDDVSVHVKLFQWKKENKGKIAMGRVPVKAFARRYDWKKMVRLNEEKFWVKCATQKDWYGYVNDLIKKEPDYKSITSENKNRKRSNSAYDFVCQPSEPQERFYVCNNLRRAQTKKSYFSNSAGWENHYNSIAVFLIYPHSNVTDLNDATNTPSGLLIIDSRSTGMFDKRAMRDVGGYLAHKFAEYCAILE